MRMSELHVLAGCGYCLVDCDAVLSSGDVGNHVRRRSPEDSSRHKEVGFFVVWFSDRYTYGDDIKF
jgi:hypothetical protein